MRGNSFGKMFSLTSFGESHGEMMGVVIDGMPSNIEIDIEALKAYLKRRKPGQIGTSGREEKDIPEIVSGVFENITLGTPICVLIENTDKRSEDYEKFKNIYRPGHADKTTQLKYGIRDYRGGGRASGRETVSRVIGGYFAGLILPQVKISSRICQIGELEYPRTEDVNTLNTYLERLKAAGEGAGGSLEFILEDVPASLGEPCFDKLKADMAHAMLSIGGCTSFSYGLGEEVESKLSSQMHEYDNRFGGIEGGISTGEKINFKVSFKPPSTYGQMSQEGRHDPCLIPRVIPVIEAMAKIVLADHYLRQKAYQDDAN